MKRATTRTRAPVPLALLCCVALACGGAPAVTATAEAPEAASPAVETSGVGLTAATEAYEVEGVTVIHKQTPGSPVVALQLHLVGGVRGTATENAGRDALMLRVLELGDASRTKAEFAQSLAAIGSGISAGASYDSAAVSCSTILSARETTWDLFADALTNPAFRPADIELEREQQLTTLRTRDDDPDTAVSDAAKRVFFAGHSYATRPLGEIANVDRFTRDDLLESYAQLFTRDRMLVSVSGDVDRATVEAFLAPLLAAFPEASDVDWALRPEAFAQHPARLEAVAQPELPTNYLLGYFSAPSPSDPGFAALQIGLEVLSDRLFDEVRTARNLTYAVASGIGSRNTNSGYLYVTATDPETTVQVMLETVATLSAPGGITERALSDQVELYLTRYWMGLQSNSGQASELARWEMLGGGWRHADAHIEALRQLTPDEVSAALERAVRDISWVALGDPEAVSTMPLDLAR